MHDLSYIRSNPDAFDAAMKSRGAEAVAGRILALDAHRREVLTKVQEAQGRRNDASKAIGQAMGKGDQETAEVLKAEVAELKQTMPAMEEQARELSSELEGLLAALPNVPADAVPEGEDEESNVEISRWGERRDFDFEAREHADIGPALGMDFETGTALSGARFTFLRGQMARLHRALAQFMLDRQTNENGYTECNPPLLVRDEAMFGTGQLPKFAEDAFKTTDDRWLISTSEISLTNAVRDQIIADDALPMRMTAHTPCFRSEAGSAGRDTRGFIRQHQFEKVELVSICRPEEAEAEHEHMLRAAQGVLEALALPYRTMLLSTGDMGFGARRTFDLEVWLPGQEAYREISSVSWCGDFQARRMNARYRPEGEKKTQFVHTLNGSGLAVGRTLVAVIENYQHADGSVAIPDVLLPYMGGADEAGTCRLMRILLTNDDGIHAPGLEVLEAIAREFTDDIWICAPDEEQSGMGHALTLTRPVRLRKHGERRFSVTGTPTDSVTLGMRNGRRRETRRDPVGCKSRCQSGRRRDLFGHGLRRDRRRAGGIRSIAFSQVVDRAGAANADTFDAARTWGAKVLAPLLDTPLPSRTLVNVNFPALPASDVRGIRAVRQGFHDYSRGTVVEGEDPRGFPYYWFGLEAIEHTLDHGTDLEAIDEGFISVTPLQLDLTHHSSLGALADRFAT